MHVKFEYENMKEKDYIRDLSVEGEIKRMYKKQDLRVSALVTSCCENDKESLGSVAGMGFTDQPYICNNCVLWNYG